MAADKNKHGLSKETRVKWDCKQIRASLLFLNIHASDEVCILSQTWFPATASNWSSKGQLVGSERYRIPARKVKTKQLYSSQRVMGLNPSAGKDVSLKLFVNDYWHAYLTLEACSFEK